MDGEPGRAHPPGLPGGTPVVDGSADPAPPPEYGPIFGPRQTRRRGRAGWIVGALIAAVAIAGAATVHVVANRAWDDASAQVASAGSRLSAAESSASDAVEGGSDAVAAATTIAQSAADAPAGAAELGAFADSAAALHVTVDAADALLTASAPPDIAAKPLWPWDLFAAVPTLEAAAEDAAASAAQLADAEALVGEASADLGETALALYATVPAAAAALESANVSAQATAVLDLRDAAASVAAQDRVGSGAEGAFARYAAAAAALQDSAAAELAEKAGPLYDTRVAIEEYARSISGGVVLDFDWSPTVNGIGGYAGMAGTATWNTGRGGFSTITLSDSVAVNWPSLDARALVTHEVGHSITSKCSDLFDSEDADANEQWATAWAISMGFDTPGNGTQAYGYPSQDLIDLAATCR